MGKTSAVQKNGSAGSERYYFLDWLRLVTILVVFLHHTAKLFDYHTTTVYNSQRSAVLSAFREFNFLWIMPLFFFISGASIFLSLRSQKTLDFIKGKVLRLLVPLIFIGTFVINPLYIYVEHLFDGHTVSGFIGWYPHFFDGIWPKGNFAPMGMGTHLWYLQYLFVYSLVLLPFFKRSTKTGSSLFLKMAVCFEKPWALLLLFIPVSAASAAFEFMGLGGTRVVGGWDPLSFLFFFIYGYVVFSDTRILETIKKYSTVSTIAAVVLTVLYIDVHFGINLNIHGVTRHTIKGNGAILPVVSSVFTVVQAFRGLLGWLWLLGLLGLGFRFLSFTNKFLAYGNEAVLPFYILHHSIILVIGYYVIQWNSNVFVKFIAAAGGSFIVIMAIYHFLVKRIILTRLLFGMKIKK